MWKIYARIRHGIHDNTRIIRCMNVECWFDKTRNTQSVYVELIRFPHKQELPIPTNMSFL